MEEKEKEQSIPISVNLNSDSELGSAAIKRKHSTRRILYITGLSFLISVVISVIAYALMKFIYLITNLSFYGKFSFESAAADGNHLGLWVIIIPAIGGIVVGLMVLYGTKDIRGHGIPEAMEQILTNKSKIKPIVTFLKPIASAFAIGTGGPFGAEGPIISTGGALGSNLGQLLKITDNERKILLSAGAAAGMAAIFGAPVASIFLAVELLLFEFSPRSLIPTAIACLTGAAGHKLFFGSAPFFEMSHLPVPTNEALLFYIILGLIVGVLSVGVTKFTYFAEDLYAKIPLHYMWYPAIGGIVVGIIGFFAPRTLGVGYDNIHGLLSNSLPLNIVLGLCIFKFLSWSISLSSGTAGGTLAPLFIIGGATGSLVGLGFQQAFPGIDISIRMCALLGMAAMFAGASRAVLTSIVFAIETTGQANALLALLAACFAAYFISLVLMKNTIMTEKVARRGVRVPDSYASDDLQQLEVKTFIKTEGLALSEESTIGEVREWLFQHRKYRSNYFVVSSEKGEYVGVLSSSSLFVEHRKLDSPIRPLVKRENIFVYPSDNLRTAVELMAKEDIDVLPVIENRQGRKMVIGVLGYQDVISSYKAEMAEDYIPRKSKGIHILRKGNQLWRKKEPRS